MRRATAVAAALALAACKLDYEGARCATPGAATECPSGQACGNDLRCTERAAACAGLCVAGRSRCAAGGLEACVTDADPVCGTWRGQACPARTACSTEGSSHAYCRCDANAGTELAVDPAAGSAVGAEPFPTGLASPPECRFRALGDALAAAASRAAATVKAYAPPGAEPGAAVTFSSEAFPLAVPATVTVAGADAPAGATVVEGAAATGATMVALQGRLERVHLRNVSMTGNAVDLTCGASGAPALQDVVVSAGAQPFAKGVTVAGECGALLERVDVSGASAAALAIAAGSATAAVTVTGGRFHGSGTGLEAAGGVLVVQPDATAGRARVDANTGTGVLLTGATPTLDATLTGLDVIGNGGTGVVVNAIDGASSLAMTGCDVQLNAASAPTTYGASRYAGGLFLYQAGLAAFRLRANRFHANHGAGTQGADEIVFSSSGAWTLDAGSCELAAANAIGCLANGGLAVSVWGGGSVDARNTIWPSWPPTVAGNVTVGNGCGVSWGNVATCP